MGAPRGAAAHSADPAGARLAFYVFGNNGACTRFLLCFVVIAATLGALSVLAPAAATILGSLLLALLGSKGAAKLWWRARARNSASHSGNKRP